MTPAEKSALEVNLTPAQRSYLAAIRAAGPGGKVYNARGRRPLKALEAVGLIECDWDMDILANGGTRWRITAIAK